MSFPFTNPDEAECKTCHDDGFVPGTYNLCWCVGGNQPRPPNPNKGPHTTPPALPSPLPKEET